MSYTNKDTFILSSSGCMDTAPDGLESILAGNDEGAQGCCLSIDLSSDGLAVLSTTGWVLSPNGTRMNIGEYSYAELHRAAPQLIPAGQAIELARTCRSKLAITVRNQKLLPQLRMTLRREEHLDETIFVGLGLVEAARIASATPDLHIMGELPAIPDNVDALVNAAQTTGLFGLRAAPAHLTRRLLMACRQAGLFTMSLPTDDPNELERLIADGVNFIETGRPDITAALLPPGTAQPHGVPFMRY